MRLAERLSTLGVETLSFQVLVTFRAFEALAVVVVIKGLNPSISSLNWEATAYTLGGEQLVPICLAIRQAILKVEGTRPKYFSTVGTAETFRVELFSNSIQTVSFDALVAFAAGRGKESLVTVFAVQIALFFNETNVKELFSARCCGTAEVVRTPVLAQGSDERSSDLRLTVGTDWYS